ncbi:hypothetical protein [Metabacillus sp. 84]|uniref:hypothetical protein n=1 Tax=Metabacillus sp. 84 TaxID=3404705 RepID=UPI003CE776D1
MTCSVCSTQQQDGSFCGSCGAALMGGNAAAVQPAAPNAYVQKGKELSGLYFSYFARALKSPVKAAENATQRDFTNAVITMALYALILPLIAFIIANRQSFIRVPFETVVLMPAITLFLIVAVMAGAVFACLKMARVNTRFSESSAVFGTYLIVPVALFAAALFSTFIQADSLAGIFAGLGLAGFFLALNYTLTNFKSRSNGGLDLFYAGLILNIIFTIVMYVVGKGVLEAIEDSLSNSFFF